MTIEKDVVFCNSGMLVVDLFLIWALFWPVQFGTWIGTIAKAIH